MHACIHTCAGELAALHEWPSVSERRWAVRACARLSPVEPPEEGMGLTLTLTLTLTCQWSPQKKGWG